MPKVKKVGDQETLVPCSSYPTYAKFKYDTFNPVQSRVFDFFQEDCNAVIAAKTSAGKTVVSEMISAAQLREKGGKVIYLAPMRALAKEKYDDWTDPEHHFADLKVSICTGDYRLTEDRKKELAEANIIIMTSEMLNSRCRNFSSEKNDWLKQVRVVIVDEAHLLTVPGRGDHLEVGLMNLTMLNSDVRFVLLSATMPNVSEIADWVSYVLTQKETYLLESEYRPCPLGIHYETYYTGAGNYEATEHEKINSALQIIEDNPDDKFILFVHTKRTGELLKKAMEKGGYKAEFHSADLDKNQREKLESKFKSKDKDGLQYLIATSTLAWGINSPARRVIIVGVHRGMSEVETYDIWQMCGRAGRPGFDPRGDVYILLPDNKEDKHRERLQNPARIDSKLLDNIGGHYKTLAFHLVSGIHHGKIKNKEEVFDWYKRTLAHWQAQGLDDPIVDSTLDLLLKRGVIKEENGTYKVTVVGMVSSMYYYSPFDVADLRKNFMQLFKEGDKYDDLSVAMALGDIDSLRMGIVSKAEREDMGIFQSKVWKQFGKDSFTETSIKGGFAYHCALTGANAGVVAATVRNLQWDFPRLIQVLHGIDQMGCKWQEKDFLNELQSRVSYGVPTHLVKLVKLPDIGRVRAERLWSLGFKSMQDIVDRPDVVRTALNMKAEKVLDIVNAAKGLILMGDD